MPKPVQAKSNESEVQEVTKVEKKSAKKLEASEPKPEKKVEKSEKKTEKSEKKTEKSEKKTEKSEKKVEKSDKSDKTEKKPEKKAEKSSASGQESSEKKTEKPARKPAKKSAKQEGGDCEEDGEKVAKRTRSFKAIYVNPSGEVVMEGRYCGAKPKQAACKALTGIYKLFKKEDSELKGEIKFGVRETTRKSRNKIYFYSGQRLLLDEPITLAIADGKNITYRFNSVVKKAMEEDCKNLLNYKCADKEDDGESDEEPQKKPKVVKKTVTKSTKSAKSAKEGEKPSKSEKSSEKKTVQKKK